METDPRPNTPADTEVPRFIGAEAERLLELRGQDGLVRLFERSQIPMLIVDGDRRYVEVNRPARLAFRHTLAELRQLRIDDLTPESWIETLVEAWGRLMATGCVTGNYEVLNFDGGRLYVVYYAVSDALPGLHLIAFAPTGWSLDDLGDELPDGSHTAVMSLTPRELEMLGLAAEGLTAPAIAEQLVLSPATVRTHFQNIYGKLGVGDRAGAVARAMRIGLIS